MRIEESHNMIVEQDTECLKIKRNFMDNRNDPAISSFLPVIQGLMRFLPSNRISADQALGLLPKLYDDSESRQVQSE
ncbi:hypothetical protein N7462_002697 [Penicillium macrosclerotiorum]|uniref:uncharacterized protein n=1 Tax=Penicillium macrosclerotiorum TaxID=303699 RepID=UPI00254774F9|nr:uncharacterized protein N7462_002697 [Penicillium macrosclerotiorum]KAJ5693274.1 hypothetical protein N7462_002697 [Penicillium macrosclerotiorum]